MASDPPYQGKPIVRALADKRRRSLGRPCGETGPACALVVQTLSMPCLTGSQAHTAARA